MMAAEDGRWMDPLLAELAMELGGAQGGQQGAPEPVPDAQASASSFPQLLMGTHSMLLPSSSLPGSLGSPGSAHGLGHSLSQQQLAAGMNAGSLLHGQPLVFQPAFGRPAAAPTAAAAAALPRPAASHSPSSSSGGQHDEYADMAEPLHRPKKPLNKGALAQKRFRERQKEKMRQNEQQVAALTVKLDVLEMERSRLESRARLLELVVSLNLTHEARLHTNREIMVREQEMLLEELAEFVVLLDNSGATGLLASLLSHQQQQQAPDDSQQQQQQRPWEQPGAQQPWMQLEQPNPQQPRHGSGGIQTLHDAVRGWTVATMADTIFPQYTAHLQRLLHAADCGGASSSSSEAAQAAAAVSRLVLRWREMADRHALFSHYYWAVWCLNRSEVEAGGLTAPAPDTWRAVLQQLSLSKSQVAAVVAARRGLLLELRRVASEWQNVLPTLALQLLQVPKEQWHSVAAVQAMVGNLASEREAVVAFLHTLLDEVLTPQQEGRLEAVSYPWCPDLWAIAGLAAELAARGGRESADSGSSGTRGAKALRTEQPQQQEAAMAAAAAAGGSGGGDDDPLAALAIGTDVLTPLMPFMTAFQLLRAPITVRGAGLRLKRALLLDPFRTVVPAAAFSQPSGAEVARMSLLDAHCGTFQQVMLWDWLKANLPCYLTLPGLAAAGPDMAG